MYETLHYIGEVLLQGLLTSLLIFVLAKWYEQHVIYKKAKTAALLIAVEIDVHIILLSSLIEDGNTLKSDSTFNFGCAYWEKFCCDLTPLMEPKQLKTLALYYLSIQHANPLLTTQNPQEKTFNTLRKHLDSARNAVQILRMWEYPVPTYELYLQNLIRCVSRLLR